MRQTVSPPSPIAASPEVSTPSRPLPPRSQGVLAAARELFFEQGYRGTTVAQIAKRAGYSKRTVYLDYLNKDELFLTVCAEGGERLLAELLKIPGEELSVEQCVERFLDAYIAFGFDRRPYFRMIFAETTPGMIANCSPAMRERVRDLERVCLGVLEQWARRAIEQSLLPAVDPWDVVVMLVGTATGMLVLSQAGSQTAFANRGRDELTKLAVRTLWQGLQTPQQPSAIHKRVRRAARPRRPKATEV